mmetsp:Transcript_11458/g.31725  ORF Transcript_11458/g.31725 Transcript_11458/m.31725 type:complete len:281 (+) Transcript_11458:710-1552(+)
MPLPNRVAMLASPIMTLIARNGPGWQSSSLWIVRKITTTTAATVVCQVRHSSTSTTTVASTRRLRIRTRQRRPAHAATNARAKEPRWWASTTSPAATKRSWCKPSRRLDLSASPTKSRQISASTSTASTTASTPRAIRPCATTPRTTSTTRSLPLGWEPPTMAGTITSFATPGARPGAWRGTSGCCVERTYAESATARPSPWCQRLLVTRLPPMAATMMKMLQVLTCTVTCTITCTITCTMKLQLQMDVLLQTANPTFARVVQTRKSKLRSCSETLVNNQ